MTPDGPEFERACDDARKVFTEAIVGMTAALHADVGGSTNLSLWAILSGAITSVAEMCGPLIEIGMSPRDLEETLIGQLQLSLANVASHEATKQ